MGNKGGDIRGETIGNKKPSHRCAADVFLHVRQPFSSSHFNFASLSYLHAGSKRVIIGSNFALIFSCLRGSLAEDACLGYMMYDTEKVRFGKEYQSKSGKTKDSDFADARKDKQHRGVEEKAQKIGWRDRGREQRREGGREGGKGRLPYPRGQSAQWR